MKNISFQVQDDLHKALKLQATQDDKGIKEYIINLIQKDLEAKKAPSK